MDDGVLNELEVTQIFVNLADIHKCNSKFMKLVISLLKKLL